MGRPGRNAGFSLIELMIVVAILGILAAIAIPNFARYQLRSRSTEGRINVAAIRTAEQAYDAEFNRFLPAVLAPTSLPADSRAAFTDPGGQSSNFLSIGWRPEGQVYFQYEVVTGCSGQCYFVGARADIDSDGNLQHWGYHHPQLILDRDGNVASTVDAPNPGTVACTTADLQNNRAGPCSIEYGRSTF